MNVRFNRIDHVMITVGDLEIARSFYQGILGFEEMVCPLQDGLPEDLGTAQDQLQICNRLERTV